MKENGGRGGEMCCGVGVEEGRGVGVWGWEGKK